MPGLRATVRENLRSQRVNPHNVPFSVASWRDHGLDTSPSQLGWKGLDAVDAETLLALTSGLGKAPAIVTVVGDTSRIDLDSRAKFGKVELHEAGDLFSF